ncbi:MAG TPA: GNAT family protein [Ktedonobacterales bacterium]|nr:GNAT family protein [Ktedonobacterales bacterium]
MTDVPVFHTLETARLRLRRFIDADMPALLAYRNDPEVARYQSWETITESDARAFIIDQVDLQPGTPGSWFQFAIALKTTDALIGDCMLHVNDDDRPQGEIGYTLARAHQGQGYATEAIRAVLAYAFETLALHRVTATADCRNAPSFRLLERVGMRREGHFLQHAWYKGEWCDEYLYAILHSEWRGERSDVG